MTKRKSPENRSRLEDTRYTEQRDREIREILDMDFDNVLNRVPKHIIPDGMEYALARECYKEGMPDKKRMAELHRRGWDPVPADRHPELVLDDMFDREGHLKGYLYIDGLVLVERPKKYGDIERRKNQMKIANEMSGLPVEEEFARRSVPGRIFNNPVEFGHERDGSFGGF